MSCSSESIGHFIGTGIFTQTGGTNAVSGTLELASNSGSKGTYNFSAGLLTASNETVGGFVGTGVFNQTGGTNTITNTLQLSSNSGSQGTYNLSDGYLSAANETVGSFSGTGTINQSGGVNTVSKDLVLSSNSISTGYYILSGSGSMSASNEFIGKSSSGIFTQTGGTNNVSNKLYIGYNASSTGVYALSGSGVLSVASGGELRVGADSGVGRLEWFGGTLSTPTLTLGTNGTLAVGFDFNIASLLNGTLYSGSFNSGSGSLEITNGATASQTDSSSLSLPTTTLFVGSLQGSGTYQLANTQQLTGSNEYIGMTGNGLFSQSGGNHTVAYLQIGKKGQYLLSGGTLAIAGGLVNKGVLQFDGTPNLSIAGPSIIDFSQGTLTNGTNCRSPSPWGRL